MQTFRISKVREQSYYAIRIFGIVHLIAAVGLVVLLDGPGNGLRGTSWALILVFLSSSVFLLVRVFQARAGRIHGHYVLTSNTLAIVLPGQPRMFVHRKDCTGVLPGSWKLVLRNGRHLPLRSVSAKPYFRDLLSGICKAWWSEFHGTPLWDHLYNGILHLDLEIRVDFRGRPDGREPLLIFMNQQSPWSRCGLVPILFGGLFVYFLALPLPTLYSAIVGDYTLGVFIRLFIISVLSLVGAGAVLKFGIHTLRQIRELGTLKDAYVLSRCSLAVLRAGDPPSFYRSDALVAYCRSTGLLDFRSGHRVLAAPYFHGEPYLGMLRCLFLRWRPGQQNPLVPTGALNRGALMIIALAQTPQIWTISGSYLPWDRYWTDAVIIAVFLLIIIAMTWHFSRKQAAERVDVSVPHGEGGEALTGADAAASR